MRLTMKFDVDRISSRVYRNVYAGHVHSLDTFDATFTAEFVDTYGQADCVQRLLHRRLPVPTLGPGTRHKSAAV